MNNIYFPLNHNKKEIYIATLAKDINIKTSDIDIEKRRELEEKFFDSINLDINKSIFMNQVHKDNIVKIEENNKHLFGGRENLVKETDALITNMRNTPLVIQTADCVPAIIYCSETKSIAAVHNSWKGTVQKIIPKTIELMKKEYNANPKKMYAYIGVYIAQKNYEVGEEVAVHFNNKIMINDRWHVDNGTEVRDQMLNLGLLEENIELSNLNSYDNEFYSYRRDKSQIGRMLTIGIIL